MPCVLYTMQEFGGAHAPEKLKGGANELCRPGTECLSRVNKNEHVVNRT